MRNERRTGELPTANIGRCTNHKAIIIISQVDLRNTEPQSISVHGIYLVPSPLCPVTNVEPLTKPTATRLPSKEREILSAKGENVTMYETSTESMYKLEPTWVHRLPVQSKMRPRMDPRLSSPRPPIAMRFPSDA